jgi:hypothetical protein
MFPEVVKYVNPVSPYHNKHFVQLFRAFLPTVYLHSDGRWTEDALADDGRAYFDTPEEAVRYIKECPYEGILFQL